MPLRIIKRITHNWYIKIISIVLAALLWIYVDSLKEKERFLTVPFEIRNIPLGYTVSSDTPPFVKIVLRGKEGNLSLVNEERIKTYVDMGKGRGGKNRGVVSVEKEGIPPGVSIKEVSPRTVELTVENLITSSVEVFPVIVGKPMEGFVFTNVFSNPSSVVIRGPSTVVKKVKSVHTESISIDGLSDTTVKEARVKIDDSKISLVDGTPLTVTIEIDEEFVIRRFDGLPIEVQNLKNGLRARTVPATSSALVKVPKRLEEKLSAGSVHVYINGEIIDRPGTVQLPLLFRADLEKTLSVRLEPQYADLMVEAIKSLRK